MLSVQVVVAVFFSNEVASKQGTWYQVFSVFSCFGCWRFWQAVYLYTRCLRSREGFLCVTPSVGVGSHILRFCQRVHTDCAGSGWLYVRAQTVLISRSKHTEPVSISTKSVRHAELCASVARLRIDEVSSVINHAASCSCPACFRCARSWRRSTGFPSDDDAKTFDICTPDCIASCARHALCGDEGMRLPVSVAFVGARGLRSGMLRGRWRLLMRTLA